MINERTLLDASICPSCSAPLTQQPSCGACGIRLDGPVGKRLWVVSTEAAHLLHERTQILETLRAEVRERSAAALAAEAAPVTPALRSNGRGMTVLPAPRPEAEFAARAAAEARPEATPRSVQEVLLGLGALLLSVAAIAFVVVSWGSMGVGGRSAIMGGVTAVALAGAVVAHRRGLASTAEAVGGLAIFFGLIDAYGVHATGLMGADAAPPLYWAGALAALTVLVGVGARFLPLTAFRASAAVGGQVSGWLLAMHVANQTQAWLAPAAVVAALTAVLMVVRALLPAGAQDARLVIYVGQPIAAVAALVLAALAAFDDSGLVSPATVLLATLAVLGAAGAYVAAHRLEVFAWSAWASTAVAGALGSAQADYASGDAAVALAVATAAGALCVLVAAVRALAAAGRRRPRPEALAAQMLVAGVVVGGSLVVVVEALVAGVVGPLTWVTAPWTEGSSVAQRPAVSVLAPWGSSSMSAAVAAVFVGWSVAAMATSALLGRARYGAAAAVVMLTVAGQVGLLATGTSLRLVLGADVLIGVLLVLSAVAAPRLARGVRRDALRPLQAAAGGMGLGMLLMAAGWSFLSAAVALSVLPLVAAALGGAAVVLARGTSWPVLRDGGQWLPGEVAGAALATGAVVLTGATLLAGVEWLRLPLTVGGALLAVFSAVGVAASLVLPVQPSRRRIAAAVPVTAGVLGAVAVALAGGSDATLTAALGATALGAVAAAVAVFRQVTTGAVPREDGSWLPAELGRAALAAGAVVLTGATLLAGVEWRGVPLTVGGALLAVFSAVGMATSLVLPVHAARRRIAAAVPVTAGVLGAVAVALAAGSDATLTAALAVLALGAVTAATARRSVWRELWSGLAVALLVAAAAAAASWGGASIAAAGFAAVVTAGVLLMGADLPRRPRVPLPLSAEPVVELVSAAAITMGLVTVAASGDAVWSAGALLAAGVATAVVALRPERRQVAWVSGALLVLSWCVRLVDLGVSAPEAYTAPGALALLVVGWVRRRRDPAASSWTAYGGPLALLLVPSLLKAATDTGTARPLLLGAVALAVFLVGASRRLQAPLVVGGGVLAVDALIQLGPELAILYSTVPKWVSLGIVGLLLLLLGATYERRLSQVRRLADGVSRMS